MDELEATVHRVVDGIDQALVQLDELLSALSEAADRLERCAVLSGTDPEFAAIAVKRYRDLIAKAGL